MSDMLFYPTDGSQEGSMASLKTLLAHLKHPFHGGDSVGIKLHWGEQDNHSYLPPVYAKEIAHWLKSQGIKPFVCDTTVLYSGGRRTGKNSLATAASHGYTEDYLGCPVVIADGMDGKDVIDIPAELTHFETVQVASIIEKANGFVIFTHFKAHLASGFGGAIKNMAMGFASRAQKQRMHADVKPVLNKRKCTKCGLCIEVCPTGAAQEGDDNYPTYDLDKCIGCAQCIGLCPEIALKITWGPNKEPFQEKLTETAAALWQCLKGKTILINALLNITADCDCLPGKPEFISSDIGFLGGYHPVTIDDESLSIIGEEKFTKTYPAIPWQRQFEYAREIGFYEG